MNNFQYNAQLKFNYTREVLIFKGLTHVLVAVSLYASLFQSELSTDIFNIIAIAFGSLLPDIDISTSKLGRYNLFAPFMKHRGRMHTFITMLFISALLYVLDSNLGLCVAFGYGIHLIMDTLTPMGIMWLYPVKMNYYSLARKHNYRKLEPLIIVLCSAFLLAKYKEIIIYGFLFFGILKVSKKSIFNKRWVRF